MTNTTIFFHFTCIPLVYLYYNLPFPFHMLTDSSLNRLRFKPVCHLSYHHSSSHLYLSIYLYSFSLPTMTSSLHSPPPPPLAIPAFSTSQPTSASLYPLKYLWITQLSFSPVATRTVLPPWPLEPLSVIPIYYLLFPLHYPPNLSLHFQFPHSY